MLFVHKNEQGGYMRKIAFPFLFLFLSACAISKTVTGPDGKELHHVNCSGSMIDWADCYEKAGKLCPHGYIVQNMIGQNPGTTATFNQFGFFAGPILIRELFVTCNENTKQNMEEITAHIKEEKSNDTDKQ